MNNKYIPTNKSCPDCDPRSRDGSCFGFPELKQATGIRWYCWQCNSYFAKGSDGKLRKIIETKKYNDKVKEDGDPRNKSFPVSKGFKGVKIVAVEESFGKPLKKFQSDTLRTRFNKAVFNHIFKENK